jgi:large repetitive protein
VLDGSGNVYVAGTTSSSAFPTTSGVFQQTNPSGSYSEFVTKVSPDGTHLLWSTYLGGSGFSFQDALAIDSQNHVWVSGTTQGGGSFPLQDAYQATEAGGL